MSTALGRCCCSWQIKSDLIWGSCVGSLCPCAPQSFVPQRCPQGGQASLVKAVSLAMNFHDVISDLLALMAQWQDSAAAHTLIFLFTRSHLFACLVLASAVCLLPSPASCNLLSKNLGKPLASNWVQACCQCHQWQTGRAWQRHIPLPCL